MDGQALTHADLVKIAGRWLRNTALSLIHI